MKCRHLLVLLLTAIALVVLIKATLSRAQGTPGTFQQGSPSCHTYERDGAMCGTASCSPIAYYLNTVCSTNIAEQSRTLCESQVKPECTVTNISPHIHCSDDQKLVSFSYSCENGDEEVATSTPLVCPISCQNCSTTQIKNQSTLQ